MIINYIDIPFSPQIAYKFPVFFLHFINSFFFKAFNSMKLQDTLKERKMWVG